MTLSTMDCIDNHHPCELIEFLVMSGANIDERDSAGSTALMEAVKIVYLCLSSISSFSFRLNCMLRGSIAQLRN